MTTPRVFIIRHGETEWSLNGRHTGKTDIPITANGEKRIRATGRALIGDDRLIVPKNLAHIYVSPRKRAQRTLELLGLGCEDAVPWEKHGAIEPSTGGGGASQARIEVTERICEWDYGAYEGLTSAEIAEQRTQKGMEKWDIWRDGCPGGESPEQITKRLDELIADIRTRFHAHAIGQPKGSVKEPYDVLIVAHGHILRAFAGRWVNKNIADNPSLILEAGGVGTLSYEHHKLDEPAILLGGAFMSDIVETAQKDTAEKNA
ncbi:phosphoglycerate mutase-like protein [Acrodontium crateriforme]|uniref:Phosphoglycerate mutase-like protein n=1 Tax=Acrodontium crateriforme TaxID=150365 RepID=A0AAQ3LZ10_9PEZI|nr:phosphoglycerate mutase-like protein [Acrodontium crateriforme]